MHGGITVFLNYAHLLACYQILLPHPLRSYWETIYSRVEFSCKYFKNNS